MDARLQKSANRGPVEKHAPNHGLLDLAHARQNFSLHRYHPSVALAHFIEHYWIIRWDLRGKPGYTSEVLPHPSVNITYTRERGWVTGVATGKYTYTLEDDGFVLGIRFRPGAFRAFLGRAVSTITDKTLPATEIFVAGGDAFRTALASRRRDEDMLADAEALIAGALPARDPNIDLINEIVTLVQGDRDMASVAEIAARFDLAERTLQHLFSNYVGVGLKWIIRRYRLMEAAELAEAGTAQSWTEIAHRLGYADQAHFSNDFTKIIGRAPTDHARFAARD